MINKTHRDKEYKRVEKNMEIYTFAIRFIWLYFFFGFYQSHMKFFRRICIKGKVFKLIMCGKYKKYFKKVLHMIIDKKVWKDIREFQKKLVCWKKC